MPSRELGGILLTRGAVTAAVDPAVTVDRDGEGVVLRLRGHVDIDSSPAFREELLTTLREESAGTVVVDLTGVSYIDASGIATLIEALKVARNRHVTLCLQGLQGRLLHLFQVTGVLSLFETSGCISGSSAAKVS